MSHMQDQNALNRTGEQSGTKERQKLKLSNFFIKCVQDTLKNNTSGPTPNFNDSDADGLKKFSVNRKKELHIKNSSSTKNKSDCDLNNDQFRKHSFVEESNDPWRRKQLNELCKNQNFNDCVYSSNSPNDSDSTYSSELYLENSNSCNWEYKLPEDIVQARTFHSPSNHLRRTASGSTYNFKSRTYSDNCRNVESKKFLSVCPQDSRTDIRLSSGHSPVSHVKKFPKYNSNAADEGGSVAILQPYVKSDNLTDISKENGEFKCQVSSPEGEFIYSDDLFAKVQTESEVAVNHFPEEDGRRLEKREEDLYNLSKPNQEQIDSIAEVLNSVRNEQAARNYDDLPRINEYLSKLVKKFLPGCSSRLYGSYLGGYAVLSSYVDLELIVNTKRSSDRQVLKEFAKFLNKENPDYGATWEEVSKNSKNTKLMFFDTKYDFTCEVKILSKQATAYKTSCLMQHLLNLDERIKTLVIVARYWAEVCGLLKEELQHNRLHPICMALLVIHFLQQHDPPVLECINDKVHLELLGENKQSIAELWLAFLRYYSIIFNWKDNVVNIRSKEPITKSSKSWKSCNWIGIEDPYDEDKNVAKSVTSQDISHYLQMCFTRTYQYFSLPTSPEDFSDDGFCEDFSDDSSRYSKIGDSSSAKNGSLLYNYKFYISNFTDGSDNAIFCSVCDNYGSTCEYCINSEIAGLQSLPRMTPEFIKIIDESLSSLYDEKRIHQSEFEKRENFVLDLENYIRKRFSGSKLILMGSSANGFGFQGSDLDICMTFENHSAGEINQTHIVREMCKYLRRNSYFKVQPIYRATIPLVKFFHSELNLRGDISLYNTLAVHNTKLLNAYSSIDSRVKVLGCAMKFLAKNGGIANAAQRCLSSYSYMLLVIYFLQQTNPPVLPVLQQLYDESRPRPTKMVDGCNVWFEDCENAVKMWEGFGKNKQSVGELWLNLLCFYADFDCQRVITISQRNPIMISNKVNRAILLNIMDPFIKNLNLGQKLSGTMRLKTHKTLLRARKLFGIPLEKCPSGFQNFKDFFFNPMNLTDGRVEKLVECELCGKPDHTRELCPLNRPWGCRYTKMADIK